MAFSEKTKKEIYQYCNSHLANEDWYKSEFNFIKDLTLKRRLIEEFRSIRFAYKLYEGLVAENENLVFEVRNQILGYATIYEAVIEYVLKAYYADSDEVFSLMHHVVPVKINIPENKLEKLGDLLEHDNKKIVPFFYKEKKKKETQVRFDDKCRTAEKIGIIHSFTNSEGEKIDLPSEIIEIYSFRNGIHLIAEQRKGIIYELELSKKAYRRMNPFINQIKQKLHNDGKLDIDML